MERPYFPVFIDMEGRLVLVAGGGRIALRRVRTLLRFGAKIRVIAPRLCRELEDMEKDRMICIEQREYKPGDIKGAAFVLAATDSREVNRQIREECRTEGIPVNVSDARDLCDFYFSSVVLIDVADTGISSGGAALGRTNGLRPRTEKTVGNSGWTQ